MEIKINLEIVFGFGGSDTCQGHMALHLKATSPDTPLATVVVRPCHLQQCSTRGLQGAAFVLTHAVFIQDTLSLALELHCPVQMPLATSDD